MSMWQERLSDHHFDYPEANAIRKESQEATAKMAKALGIESPQTREESLAKQLEETRHELRAARARIEWLKNKNESKQDHWQVNSFERARYMLKHIAKTHGLTTDELIGDRRFRDIVLARQCLMWELCKHVPWSLPRIGRFCGDRDHTTVLHAKRKVEAAIADGSYTPLVWPWEEGNED